MYGNDKYNELTIESLKGMSKQNILINEKLTNSDDFEFEYDIYVVNFDVVFTFEIGYYTSINLFNQHPRENIDIIIVRKDKYSTNFFSTNISYNSVENLIKLLELSEETMDSEDLERIFLTINTLDNVFIQIDENKINGGNI